MLNDHGLVREDTNVSSKKWVSGSIGATDAIVRLFCFAHAGGGASFFRPWREALLPEIEVCPVVLPGREGRWREQPYSRIERLIDPLCAALLPYTDRPFALFGHSLGSIIAYEVARKFSAHSGSHPLCLFVSGRRAPHLPARHRPFYNLPDEEFIAEVAQLNGTPLEVLQQKELLDQFMPCLRADFELNETYTPLPGPRLFCPVSALMGNNDPEVDVQEMSAWQYVTSGDFKLRIFDGDHFYLKGNNPDVLAALRADLTRTVSILI